MNNSIRTSEVLSRAADLIEERGWCQLGQGWDGANLCLEGGIAAAMGKRANRGGDDGIWPEDLNKCPAALAVREHLEWDKEYIYQWNDAYERTASEVIEVLRAAAVIEAAREESRIIPGPVVPAPVEDETSVSS